MKRTLAVLMIAALALPRPAYARAERYTLDPAHTNIVWHVNHFGFSNPSGKFTGVQGVLMLDEENPAASTLDVTVDAESIVTGNPKLDAHLKSIDFFNTDRHPTLHFVSTRVDVAGKDMAKVYGQFSMLGVTMPLMLDVKLNKIGISPVTHKKTAGFSATAMVKRSQYGMTYGMPGLGDEVLLTIESEAILDQPNKP